MELREVIRHVRLFAIREVRNHAGECHHVHQIRLTLGNGICHFRIPLVDVSPVTAEHESRLDSGLAESHFVTLVQKLEVVLHEGRRVLVHADSRHTAHPADVDKFVCNSVVLPSLYESVHGDVHVVETVNETTSHVFPIIPVGK